MFASHYHYMNVSVGNGFVLWSWISDIWSTNSPVLEFSSTFLSVNQEAASGLTYEPETNSKRQASGALMWLQ